MLKTRREKSQSRTAMLKMTHAIGPVMGAQGGKR
jgi:hypothetical protein